MPPLNIPPDFDPPEKSRSLHLFVLYPSSPIRSILYVVGEVINSIVDCVSKVEPFSISRLTYPPVAPMTVVSICIAGPLISSQIPRTTVIEGVSLVVEVVVGVGALVGPIGVGVAVVRINCFIWRDFLDSLLVPADAAKEFPAESSDFTPSTTPVDAIFSVSSCIFGVTPPTRKTPETKMIRSRRLIVASPFCERK